MNDTTKLKIRLQSLGVILPDQDRGRSGGAGPAAGKSLIFNNTVANAPTQGWFVESSPFSIRELDGSYWIHEKGEPVTKVRFPKTPGFYSKKTSDGVDMKKIALLHGASCLASTVCQRCVHYGTKDACAFCGIELSLKSGATIEEKTPAQLAEVAVAAREEGAVSHVTLTSGTRDTRDKGLRRLFEAASAIKDESGLAVNVQVEPLDDLSIFEEMPSYGVDTIGIHVESLDWEILKKYAPVKARAGFYRFKAAWEKSREVLGDGQVESFVIAGLGEDRTITLARMRAMAEAGAYPFIVPLRPIPSTPLGTMRPPSPEYMECLLEDARAILHDTGLSWKRNKAGCLRCRACSSLPDAESD